MTTLITGGTGKTGSRLSRLIHAAGYPFLIASRAGATPGAFKAVKFDWTDPSTFGNPFKSDSNIDKVYLIAPTVVDVLPLVQPFIDLAISKGVKRFVVVSTSQTKIGGSGIGELHEYLVNIGVDYTVLRPTWFIENFAGLYYQSIREKNEICTVTENGRIPFIGADDIAKAAFDSLFAEKSPNTDYYLVGPELYSYDEAAVVLSEVLGRNITHKHLTKEEGKATFLSFGLAPEHVDLLIHVESLAADGSEEALVGNSKTITGTHTLREFVEGNRQIWAKG